MTRVITYLALWRLEEIGFASFSRFVQCFDPAKMAALIGFLFDPVIIQQELKASWCGILDDSFVKERIIDPLLHHVSNGIQLVSDLVRLNENGMEIHKSSVPTTVQDPFLLTVPKPRKLPIPPFKISKETKARAIPKNLFKTPKDQILLEQAKQENKERAKKLYEKTNKSVFSAAKPRSSTRTDEVSKID